MGPDFLKPKVPLGEKIHCVSFTKEYFYKKNISPEKSQILKDFTQFEDIPIQYMNQVHGNKLETIFSHSSFPIDETDSLFSSTSNLALGVLTADCLPIALSKNDGSEFAILHAGWKGLLSGVIESTLTTFTKGCSDVSAWIGPSISLKNYEVGNDLYESFRSTYLPTTAIETFFLGFNFASTTLLQSLNLGGFTFSKFNFLRRILSTS